MHLATGTRTLFRLERRTHFQVRKILEAAHSRGPRRRPHCRRFLKHPKNTRKQLEQSQNSEVRKFSRARPTLGAPQAADLLAAAGRRDAPQLARMQSQGMEAPPASPGPSEEPNEGEEKNRKKKEDDDDKKKVKVEKVERPAKKRQRK